MATVAGTLPPVVAQAFAAIALGLLGLAGIAKLVDPAPTSGALRAAGLPSSGLSARLLGVVEMAAAVVALSLGAQWVLPAAMLYLGFTVFTSASLRSETPIQSCGCFGRNDTPPSWAHVIYNASAGVVLIYVAVFGRSVVGWDTTLPELMLYLAFVSIGVYASYLLLTALPQTLSLRSR